MRDAQSRIASMGESAGGIGDVAQRLRTGAVCQDVQGNTVRSFRDQRSVL